MYISALQLYLNLKEQKYLFGKWCIYLDNKSIYLVNGVYILTIKAIHESGDQNMDDAVMQLFSIYD